MNEDKVDIEELFESLPKKPVAVRKEYSDHYGRGKDFNLTQVMADIAQGFKYCTGCGEPKSINQFNKRAANVTGYTPWCKGCASRAFKGWREDNIETVLVKDRAKHYTRKFRLSPEASLFYSDPANRLGSCPICKEIEHLVLDHDHATGQNREFICSSCNSMLGYAKDSLDNLYNAIAYLKKHKGV